MDLLSHRQRLPPPSFLSCFIPRGFLPVSRSCKPTGSRDADANKGPRAVWSGRPTQREEGGENERQSLKPHKTLILTLSGHKKGQYQANAPVKARLTYPERYGGDTHRRRGWMVADISPSFSLTPQGFTPTTWRLGGGAGRSAACREGMRESGRFIAPTRRGGRERSGPFVISLPTFQMRVVNKLRLYSHRLLRIFFCLFL